MVAAPNLHEYDKDVHNYQGGPTPLRPMAIDQTSLGHGPT